MSLHTIDLSSGFWQIPLNGENKEITAFSTRKGHYQFNVLQFGLTNAPATCQRMMHYFLTGLCWSICVCFLDDVIIWGRSNEEHLERLRIVLERISEAG